MVSMETAALIWECYREIAAAEKLLAGMEKDREDHHGEDLEPQLKDAFGRRKDLRLGIPSGQSSHTLYSVDWKLAESVIRAHIANKQAELVVANEKARIESDGK